jgi:two-component system LytT family response regulator
MPDLIFLDIQLQGETGFDLFSRVQIDSKVVFITAFDNYAVRAFEANALDYLLKPVSQKRFDSTMNRVFKESKGSHNDSQCFEYNDVIFLSTSNRFLVHLSQFDHPIAISQRRSANLKKKIPL